jgi:hypothetical protein
MRPARWLAACALLAVTLGAPALAYTPGGTVVDGRFIPRNWPAGSLPLTFRVNDRPLSLLSNFAADSTPTGAIDAAIKSWTAGAGIGVRNGGPTSTLNVGRDQVNLITFADTPQNRDFTANVLGLTMVLFNPNNGETVETDIVLNPKLKWATDGRADAYDAEETLAHEMGHALGLGHSGLLSSTMNPTGGEGSIRQRALDADDLAGARFLYPVLESRSNGILTGRVTTTDNRGVLGAHVVAVDSRGVALIGAATLPDGSFRLTSLPSGAYQVYVEPLDGPITLEDIGRAFADGNRSFRTQFAGGNTTPASYTVTAGQTTVVGQIKVEAQAPTFNPLYLGLMDADGTARPSDLSITVKAGSNAVLLVMGKGLAAVPTAGIGATGADISINRSVVDRGTEGGYAYAWLPFHVAAGAAPGPRSLTFATATERAFLSGAIEIAP